MWFNTLHYNCIGPPAMPEVTYKIISQDELLFSWFRPFTWEEYAITSYRITCDDDLVTNKRVYDNSSNIKVNLTLSQKYPDCHQFNCSVTAKNEIGESNATIVLISFPTSKSPHTIDML